MDHTFAADGATAATQFTGRAVLICHGSFDSGSATVGVGENATATPETFYTLDDTHRVKHIYFPDGYKYWITITLSGSTTPTLRVVSI